MSPAFDASIPVLTEILQGGADGAAAPALQGTPLATPATAPQEPAMPAPGNDDWEQLERRLAERILHQLHGRIDFVLEQRLRDSVAEVLDHALDGLTADIRQGLQRTLETVVARAVTQELAHLQTLKK
jgi:hypothetical protein